MKYIDADKLIRLVGELKTQAQRNCCDVWGIVPEALEEVEGFITSLQQEQPEVDLEKEIRDWCNNAITGYEPIYTGSSLKYSMLPECARHFYELASQKYEK